MFLSFYEPSKFKADDDNAVARYLLSLGNHAFEWDAHAKAIQHQTDKKIVCAVNLDTGAGLLSLDDLREKLKSGPVIIGTNKMGGLPGGHIILAVDNTPDGKFYCNDPYGDANTGYKDPNGASVIYHAALFDAKHPSGPFRAIYAEA